VSSSAQDVMIQTFFKRLSQVKRPGVSCTVQKIHRSCIIAESCKVSVELLKSKDDVGNLFQLAGHVCQ